jgi:hypothetical protein
VCALDCNISTIKVEWKCKRVAPNMSAKEEKLVEFPWILVNYCIDSKVIAIEEIDLKHMHRINRKRGVLSRHTKGVKFASRYEGLRENAPKNTSRSHHHGVRKTGHLLQPITAFFTLGKVSYQR